MNFDTYLQCITSCRNAGSFGDLVDCIYPIEVEINDTGHRYR